MAATFGTIGGLAVVGGVAFAVYKHNAHTKLTNQDLHEVLEVDDAYIKL